MKKLISFLVLMLVVITINAQSKFTWHSFPCYSQIQVGEINWGYNKDAGGYLWGVAIKNVSSRKLQVSYRFIVGGERYAGGGFQVTRYLNPGEIWKDGDSKFTALLFKNNSTQWEIEVKDLCYDGDDCFKIGYIGCDGKRYGGRESSNNNITSNSTSTFNATDLQAAIDKINSLCGKLNLARANAASLNAKYCNKTWQRTDAELREANSAIAAMEKEIDSEDSREKAAQKAAEDKAAAEQKALEDKQAQFEKYMTDGDNYLSSENYNSAINSYSNAVNSATNTSETSRAQNALAAAQKAKADADRKIRVAEKQAVEKRQNEATTAAVTGFAGAMALVKDNYSNGKFAAKFKVGLGYGSIPLIVNSTKQLKSSIKNSNQILFDLAFRLGFFNNKGISFDITPALGIGLSSFQKGTDGGSEEYGGTGTLWLGKKAKSVFKLFAEGGYFFKNGTYNYDEDVALGPTSATDNVEKGEFKYKLLRYGGGFKISFVNDDDLESYVKPGMFLETPSFFSKTTKPTMVFNLQAYILSNALIDFSYSKNYFIPGKLDYASNFKKENKNYFSIKIIRQGKLK